MGPPRGRRMPSLRSGVVGIVTPEMARPRLARARGNLADSSLPEAPSRSLGLRSDAPTYVIFADLKWDAAPPQRATCGIVDTSTVGLELALEGKP